MRWMTWREIPARPYGTATNEAAHPGIDAAFVGEGDACFAVLEPGGMSVGVFGCGKPIDRIKTFALESPMSRVFPGPHAAALAAASDGGEFGLLNMSGEGAEARGFSGGVLELGPGEAVLQVSSHSVTVLATSSTTKCTSTRHVMVHGPGEAVLHVSAYTV